ncbi:hypothetical protein LCGC14_2569370, partial [marine sediment metagenome]
VGTTRNAPMNLEFGVGDEVALATDGLFNYPYLDGWLGDVLLGRLRRSALRESLHELLVASLDDAGRHNKPLDDVTVLTIYHSYRHVKG